MTSKKLTGIVPVLVTPLNSDKSVDKVALKNLCEYYEHSQNITGIWILGTGGEDMCLSFEQRVIVADVTSKALSNRVMKIIGCSFYSPMESLSFIDAIKEMNFDAYHAMPYHPKVSLNQIYEWYRNLASYCDKPLWAYTSGNWAQHMGPDFISKVKKIPNIGGVKYSSSNIVDIQGAIALQDENFQVITAVVKTLYSCLCLGVEAATSVEASIFTPEIQEIFNLYDEGDLSGALVAQNYLNNCLLKYPSPAAEDNFLRVAEIKYILSEQGLCEEYITDYYRGLSETEKKILSSWYDKNLRGRRQ
jgi:dihydrodipicolinate synthase/N-acetylneuraminate lyase